MQYTNVGKTGLKVSRLCLGCMSYGVPERGTHTWTLTRSKAARSLPGPSNWASTSSTRRTRTPTAPARKSPAAALRDFAKREDVVIATKVFYPTRKDANAKGLSRKAIMTEIDGSLRRLGTDYIDLYQIHRWDYRTPIEETLEALHDVVKAGKARYLGASSMFAWQFCTALHLADRHGWTRFVSMQNHYNLLYREEEREMLGLCRAEGIGVIPWSPLAHGKLTRPWENEPSTSRAASDEFGKTLYARPATEESDRQVIERVGTIATFARRAASEVALAWLLAQSVVTSPIVGATKPQHLEDAVAALSLTLSTDELATLAAALHPPRRCRVRMRCVDAAQLAPGQIFGLQITDYEFPDEELGPTEDNPADEFDTGRFLVVSVTFCDAGREWRASGPIMTTTELQRLVDWLESLAAGTRAKQGVYFTERDLEFSTDANQTQLYVHASWDFLPDWHKHGTLTLDFPLAEIDLTTVTNDLKEQLAQFPGMPPLPEVP